MRRFWMLGTGLVLLAAPLRAQIWSRAAIGNFRIYTDAPAALVAPLLDDLITTQRDFEVIWPAPPLAGQPPGILFFYGDPREYYHYNPPVDGQSLAMTAGASADWTYAIMVNLTSPVPNRPAPVGPALRRFYVGYLVRSIGERTPPWLNVGLLKLMESARFTAGAIELPPFAPDLKLPGRSEGSEAGLKEAIDSGRYLGLEDLLGAAAAPKGQDGAAFGYQGRGTRLNLSVAAGVFVDESVEFIEFCLFGEQGRYRPGFIRFAQPAANGPLDEADFRRFFGSDYRAFQLALWRSREFARSRMVRLPAPRETIQLGVPPGSFQRAALGEILDLEAKWLAAHAPDADSN